ncbi:diaminopimelate decarboxylase, partial [Pseudomonas syringae pv. actinidiae ICMP 18807]
MHKLPETVLGAIHEARALESDPLAAFFYDLDALQQHVSEVMAALPSGVELYYAIKANSEALMLETLAPLVSGFEISSGGEIERVMACPTRKPYVFSGPGKLDSDLRSALLNKVEAVHLESLNEI